MAVGESTAPDPVSQRSSPCRQEIARSLTRNQISTWSFSHLTSISVYGRGMGEPVSENQNATDVAPTRSRRRRIAPSPKRCTVPPWRRHCRRAAGRAHRCGQILRRTTCLAEHQSLGTQGRSRRRARPLRIRQVDPVPGHQPAGDDPVRDDRDRRHQAARRRQGAGQPARRCRHGVPVLQPLRPQDDPGERHAGPDQGPEEVRCRGQEARDGAAEAGRRRQSGGQVSGAAVRRPAAARRDRPGAGHGPQGDLVRRADLGAGSRRW